MTDRERLATRVDIATAIPHPLSGELLDGDDRQAIVRALAETEDELDRRRRLNRPVLDGRDRLLQRRAELDGPAELPRPVHRTPTQDRVARCGRCREPMDSFPIVPKAELERLRRIETLALVWRDRFAELRDEPLGGAGRPAASAEEEQARSELLAELLESP